AANPASPVQAMGKQRKAVASCFPVAPTLTKAYDDAEPVAAGAGPARRSQSKDADTTAVIRSGSRRMEGSRAPAIAGIVGAVDICGVPDCPGLPDQLL